MARTDEKKDLSVDDKFELLLSVLAQKDSGGITKEDLAAILTQTAQVSAQTMQKALKPENETHPGLSAFSHAEGDQKQPKGALPFECYYNGYPVHKFPETETWREWQLYSQVKPGEYTVIRKDGTPMHVTVRGEKDALGKLTKVWIEHPILRDEKGLVPPKTVLLYQILHNENPRKAFVEAMQEHIASMLPESAAV